MYYVCSYAASIGGELTGGSVINSMIKIRKGIPYYPKIAHRLSESVLGDVFEYATDIQELARIVAIPFT